MVLKVSSGPHLFMNPTNLVEKFQDHENDIIKFPGGMSIKTPVIKEYFSSMKRTVSE